MANTPEGKNQPRRPTSALRTVLRFGGAMLAGVIANEAVHLGIEALPVPEIADKGHRFFGTPNQKAHDTTARVLNKYGLGPKISFNVGATRQTLLADKRTVIAWFEGGDSSLPPNAISVAVDKPKTEAEWAASQLRDAGFTAEVQDVAEDLIIVKSNAFSEWTMVFRKAWYKMPQPEGRALPDVQ